MQKPKEFHRTTLNVAFDEHTVLPLSGIYILAYMGEVVYVGKAMDISARLRSHCVIQARKRQQLIDGWLWNMVWDYGNVRLDILETPDECDEQQWLRATEAACIRQFRPLLNVRLNTH